MALEEKKLDAEQYESTIASQIASALKGLRFGSVEIVIHESKVVQIERKEKLRFDNRSSLDRQKL